MTCLFNGGQIRRFIQINAIRIVRRASGKVLRVARYTVRVGSVDSVARHNILRLYSNSLCVVWQRTYAVFIVLDSRSSVNIRRYIGVFAFFRWYPISSATIRTHPTSTNALIYPLSLSIRCTTLNVCDPSIRFSKTLNYTFMFRLDLNTLGLSIITFGGHTRSVFRELSFFVRYF